MITLFNMGIHVSGLTGHISSVYVIPKL